MIDFLNILCLDDSVPYKKIILSWSSIWKAAKEYAHTSAASVHPIDVKRTPYTTNNVANTSVNITDQKKMPLGCTDQKCQLFRVTNMVKYPATTGFKNRWIEAWLR